MVVLAALNLWWGLWARLAPRHFFDNFPGFGHRWTAAYPPYNEHLVTDLGATFLTLAFFLVVGAAMRSGPVRRLALGGVLLFNALHLSFHATDDGTMAPFDFGASLATLIGGVVVPAVLLLLDLPRTRDSGDAELVAFRVGHGDPR
jgi:hypothetical protein